MKRLLYSLASLLPFCAAGGLDVFVAVLALLWGAAQSGMADIITLDARDSGWYNAPGSHEDFNKNYLAGISLGSFPLPEMEREHRNFFVFDLSGISGPIVGAQLRLFNPGVGYGGPSGGLTYSLFDVLTPISDLEAFHIGRADIFDDLGSGTSYGSKIVGPADAGRIIAIDLNSAALLSLTAHEGAQFALGGALAAFADEQFIFGGTDAGTETRQLVLDVVPEPSTLLLLGIGSMALIAFSRRQQKRAAVGGCKPGADD